ncbi:hypothetical protein PVAG01_00655 [Phlyctema vagabunda]|uniref:F-box domain-containing protein n=1 Tax=Phlyctema vagabunda TaxID=108571 RepID=A0ABR4PW96_9HELO
MSLTCFSFPPEIIDEIVRAADDPTLLLLSRSSRMLNRVANQTFYSEITIRRTRPGCNLGTAKLLMTVIENPEIASYIKKLDTEGEGVIPPQRLQNARGLQKLLGDWFTKEALIFLQDERGEAEERLEVLWQARLGLTLLDSMVGMLMCFCPRLQSVRFREVTHINFDMLRGVIDVVRRGLLLRAKKLQLVKPASPGAMTSLREIRVEYQGFFRAVNTGELRLSDLMIYIGVPSVRSFVVHNFLCVNPVWSPEQETPTELTRLAFTNSGLLGDKLDKLLSYCPSLTVFQYEHHSTFLENDDEAGILFRPPVVRAALERCKSLEELLLIDHEENRREREWGQIVPPSDMKRAMSSLKSFTRLKKLTVSSYILLGRDEGIHENPSRIYSGLKHANIDRFLDKLPHALEELTLLDCLAHEMWPIIDALLTRREESWPYLRSIRLDFQFGSINSCPVAAPDEMPQWLYLYRMFRKEAIHIEIDGTVVFPCRDTFFTPSIKHVQLGMRLEARLD